MPNKNPIGGRLVGIWHRTLVWAVDAIVQALPPEKLSKLNVRAGEHLAAILTTAFLAWIHRCPNFWSAGALVGPVEEGCGCAGGMIEAAWQPV
jgi:hypothetical protein